MEPDGVPLMASSSVLLLIGVGRQLQRRLDEELAVLGLTLRHLGALGHLSHRPDLSYSDLARRAGITVQSMHATVRGLEELGAVRRTLAGTGTRRGWRSPGAVVSCSTRCARSPWASTGSCSAA